MSASSTFNFKIAEAPESSACAPPPSSFTHTFDVRSPDSPAKTATFRPNGYYQSYDESRSREGKYSHPVKPKGPPRPRNAYIIFQGYTRKQHPGLRQRDLFSLTSRRWKALPFLEKNRYYEEAEEEKKKHRMMYPEYKFNPQRTKETVKLGKTALKDKRTGKEKGERVSKRAAPYSARSSTPPCSPADVNVMNNFAFSSSFTHSGDLAEPSLFDRRANEDPYGGLFTPASSPISSPSLFSGETDVSSTQDSVMYDDNAMLPYDATSSRSSPLINADPSTVNISAVPFMGLTTPPPSARTFDGGKLRSSADDVVDLFSGLRMFEFGDDVEVHSNLADSSDNNFRKLASHGDVATNNLVIDSMVPSSTLPPIITDQPMMLSEPSPLVLDFTSSPYDSNYYSNSILDTYDDTFQIGAAIGQFENCTFSNSMDGEIASDLIAIRGYEQWCQEYTSDYSDHHDEYYPGSHSSMLPLLPPYSD